ncbi:hypothetical protein [Herbaspirillum robiniae]|uniref:hypothetical protein n=1 Tax=Herbaspirillum robiniae TaxID=2014887 RepID=UPI00101AD9DD|nr:hypothetical protein [Herbaspirillum robiniae]
MHIYKLSLFFFAAMPFALLPWVVLKIHEVQNHSNDVVAFEAECLIVRALTISKFDVPGVIVPPRKWIATALLATTASFCLHSINAATTAKMAISAVVVVTCKIFVSAVRGEKGKITSACDSPSYRAIEPVVTKDEQQKEITVSY